MKYLEIGMSDEQVDGAMTAAFDAVEAAKDRMDEPAVLALREKYRAMIREAREVRRAR